jgi:GTP-binding protein Era
MQRGLELVRRQWEGLQSREWIQIALVGPARTGKQSLIEGVLQGETTSVDPVFTVVDTQGLEEFLGYGTSRNLPSELLEAEVILLVLDAGYGFTEDTIRMVQRLSSLDKPFLAVLNKIDSVERPRSVVALAKRELGCSVIPVCAFKPGTADQLLKAIISVYPKALFPLSRRFPGFRRTVCNGVITQAAVGCGLIGAIPIPVSDILPISAIQTAMLLKIARVYGFRIDRGRARELLPMMAVGGLIREGCHRLREEFPDLKKIISVSVGGTWTFLVGRAAVLYFERLSETLDGPVNSRATSESKYTDTTGMGQEEA